MPAVPRLRGPDSAGGRKWRGRRQLRVWPLSAQGTWGSGRVTAKQKHRSEGLLQPGRVVALVSGDGELYSGTSAPPEVGGVAWGPDSQPCSRGAASGRPLLT